jgi:hypothetical protein
MSYHLSIVASLLLLCGCAAKKDTAMDVCKAIRMTDRGPLGDVLISGTFTTDARHSSYFEGVECKGARVETYLKRKKGSNELDAIGGEEFLSQVFRGAMKDQIFSYHLVARGTLLPAGDGMPEFIISEVVDLTPRQKEPEGSRDAR